MKREIEFHVLRLALAVVVFVAAVTRLAAIDAPWVQDSALAEMLGGSTFLLLAFSALELMSAGALAAGIRVRLVAIVLGIAVSAGSIWLFFDARFAEQPCGCGVLASSDTRFQNVGLLTTSLTIGALLLFLGRRAQS